MSLKELQKKPEWAVLSDMQDIVLIDGLWHRVSDWQGLRFPDRIPDEERIARTWCAKFIALGSETKEGDPGENACPDCEKEWHRARGADEKKCVVCGDPRKGKGITCGHPDCVEEEFGMK
jgi:hypothetical protein